MTIELIGTATYTLGALIGRLLLQQTLAAPCGESAEDITEHGRIRQAAWLAYLPHLCALTLVVGPVAVLNVPPFGKVDFHSVRLIMLRALLRLQVLR